MKPESALTFKKMLIILACIWSVGPFLLLIGMLSGGRVLDGLMGVYTNTALQDFLIGTGILSLPLVVIGSFIWTLVLAIKRFSGDKRYLALVGLSLIVPPTILFVVFWLAAHIQ